MWQLNTVKNDMKTIYSWKLCTFEDYSHKVILPVTEHWLKHDIALIKMAFLFVFLKAYDDTQYINVVFRQIASTFCLFRSSLC